MVRKNHNPFGEALVPEKHVLFIRNQITSIPLRRKPNDR